MSTAPRCIPIADAHGVGAGGKAEGLALLSALGLPVPDGFVILNPATEYAARRSRTRLRPHRTRTRRGTLVRLGRGRQGRVVRGSVRDGARR